MSETAAQILASIAALPPQEQQELLLVLLQRTIQSPQASITDAELVGMADRVFCNLDEEEGNGHTPSTR